MITPCTKKFRFKNVGPFLALRGVMSSCAVGDEKTWLFNLYQNLPTSGTSFSAQLINYQLSQALRAQPQLLPTKLQSHILIVNPKFQSLIPILNSNLNSQFQSHIPFPYPNLLMKNVLDQVKNLTVNYLSCSSIFLQQHLQMNHPLFSPFLWWSLAN